jgi:hypothetical protein
MKNLAALWVVCLLNFVAWLALSVSVMLLHQDIDRLLGVVDQIIKTSHLQQEQGWRTL